MCWFITIGISAKGTAAVEALGRQRAGLGVRSSKNPYLAAIFPKDDIRFELTHGGCSCELVPEVRDRGRAKVKQLRHRYQRQGWSEAKIARALQAAEAAQLKRSQRRDEAVPKQLLRNTIVKHARQLGSVRVFAHFYRGSQDDEEVVCSGRHRVKSEEFAQGDFPE